jgi:protein involved in polysaccharide export with SLBB domain
MVLSSVISLVKGEAVVPKLRSGQSIQIAITGGPASEKKRLDATYSISKNGVLMMWKIGKIKAAGKTKAALAKEIAAAYKKAEIYDGPVFQLFNPDYGDEDFSDLQ